MTAEVIQLFKPKPQKIQNRKCSFCGTPEAQAKKFIASEQNNHCICGECIVAAKERLTENVVS
jgi:hypothetical protein